MAAGNGAPLEPCCSLWIGELGAIERACLRSVVRQGHPLALYTYGALDGVPEGVEVRDAAAILPESAILRHRSGSLALFSDWFRYELQRREAGIWIDTDIYLLRPIPAGGTHLFGWQEPGLINGAVLRTPSDSAVLAALIDLFGERTVPFWLPARARLAASVRRALTGRTGIAAMPWGTAGPVGITALARRHGCLDAALPRETFYPVHYSKAGWVRDPGLSLEAMVSAKTCGVHLWNEQIKGFKQEPSPPGTFLARLQAEGA